MHNVRNPNRRQLAGAMETGKAHSIATVRLDPVARTLGNERWRHDCAFMAQTDDLAIEIVAGRTRLVTEVQLGTLLRQLGHHQPH